MTEALNHLVEFGLTDKEASIYLALLEIGPSPVQDVASKSGANRSTSYAVLESLRVRGLVSVENTDRHVCYTPAPPEMLSRILEEEQRIVQQKMLKLESAMPMFRALHNVVHGKPIVRFFEGEEGLMEARSLLMQNTEGEFLSFCAVDESIIKMANVDTRQRLQMNRRLSGRCLIARKKGVELPERDVRNWIYKEIPYESAPFSGELNIIGITVAAFTVQNEPMAFIVEHQMMADLFRAVFESAWRSA